MINTNVVLVLGAGASCPYDFPSGEMLKANVVDINGSDRIDEFKKTFKHDSFDEEAFELFRVRLQRSPVRSVDAFLEANPNWMAIGKQAIAYRLIQRENPDRLINENIARDNWYQYVFELLIDSGLDSLSDNKFSVITFNYDRSFEFYLINGLMNTFGLSFRDAKGAMTFLKVVHVHGQLGELSDYTATGVGRNYSTAVTVESVNIAANGIKIISELSSERSHPDWDGFRSAWDLLEDAEFIVFIGFRYNRQNLNRLLNCKIKSTEDKAQPHITGSLLGFKRSEIPKLIDPAFQNMGVNFTANIDPKHGALDFIRESVGLFVDPTR